MWNLCAASRCAVGEQCSEQLKVPKLSQLLQEELKNEGGVVNSIGNEMLSSPIVPVDNILVNLSEDLSPFVHQVPVLVILVYTNSF